VPDSDINDVSYQKKKPPEGDSHSNPTVYQAAIIAGFDFRRYAMKPMPASSADASLISFGRQWKK
jgi:hypothetical protein